MIRRMTLLVATLFGAWLQSSVATAQEGNHCEWLLRYGIYDTEEYHFDRYLIGHLRTLLKASKAETYEEFVKEAASLGIGIPGIVSVNFGGNDAKSNFKSWKQSLMDATDFGSQEYEKLRVVVKKISPTLMATVKKCLEDPPKNTLVGWVRPSKDDLTFRLTLKYNPSDDAACEITSVSFRSSIRGAIDPLKGDEGALLSKGKKVPIAGLSVAFQRQKPTEGLTVVVNTTKGPKEFDIPGVDPNEIIYRLNQKVAELERQVDTLSKRGAGLKVGVKQVEVAGQDNGGTGIYSPAGPHVNEFSIAVEGNPKAVWWCLQDHLGNTNLPGKYGYLTVGPGDGKSVKLSLSAWPNAPKAIINIYYLYE